MQTIQATDDGSNFHRILDAAERGESIVITRNGKQIARLIPEVVIDRERVQWAIDEMRALRQRIGKVSLEEILSMRDEGRA